MDDRTLFLGKFLRHGTAIASIAPSSRWLAHATLQNIDWRSARSIIELGAGTGPMTRVIRALAHPECRVLVVERDPDFAELLHARFSERANFEVIQGDVRDLAALLHDRGFTSADHVVSGLPVPSFARDLRNIL